MTIQTIIREAKVLERSEKGSLPQLKRFQREKLDRFG